ncbi:LacI family DNA-binding transcriptional regulator [Novosphingobium flavum]|uniref:LacI family DNA-binding transcriptional regulator n=1 Tax=Novosphingobium flavum TaxID=1778672 RepID=UPI0031B56729
MTSFDVAALAGVSQSTVSRALAGDPVVSEPTRTRVVAAARELNYHVDENAARLRTGRTGTIAVVVISRDSEDHKDVNPFYFSLLGAICAAASNLDHETLVSFQHSPDSLSGRYEEQRKADGLIVIGTTANKPAWDYYRQLGESGANVVYWGSPFDDLDWIRSDNRQGARLATEHLIASGYRRIACITSEGSPQRQFKERSDGYCQRMAEDGLETCLIEIDESLAREEQGRKAVAELIERGWNFDAIFVVCDQVALGVLLELHERGIAVPGQVGVVGFDGIRSGAYAIPPLTSLEPDFQSGGQMLVEKLLRRMTDKSNDGEQSRVPVRLVARASSRGPEIKA